MIRIEIRGGTATLEGYVNAVGRDSRALPSPSGPFIERVEPGTFARALSRGSDVELRFNHTRALGSVASKSLELSEDAIGLRARAVVSDPEVVAKARARQLRGWSFGFRTLKDNWEDAEPLPRRHLEDIELREVSILDRTPAYIATSIEERGEDVYVIEERSEPDDCELVEDDTGDDSPGGNDDAAGQEARDNNLAVYKYRRLKLGGMK